MTKKTSLSLLIMVLLSVATIWNHSLRYYPLLLGFAYIVINGFTGKITFSECGLNPMGIGVIFKRDVHRELFFFPFIVVAIEILFGRILFDRFSEYALARIDEYLIFNSSTTLIFFTIILVALEEIPWRCHFQLHIGRQFPNGWALLLPATFICFVSLSFPISALSAYFFVGMFVRRILWGMLYENSGSIWIVVLSHFLAVMFYLILLVGM